MDSLETTQLALAYAALLLHDAEAEVSADNLKAVITAAGMDLENFWYGMFARAMKGADLEGIIGSLGSAPTVVAVPAGAVPQGSAAGASTGAAAAAAEEKKEEAKEESDEDLGFGLFD
ncbi:60S acidic ribosomal protein P1 [Cyanidioschyzon merolae strain 10D]|jgi:large subunit ribosomal protein LP1|uniref:60S acidic ribosomal protein P1 n=1 Tax=Cyanidioschyzon merolae (strain NIES-3377 / 10D) TaxID=280699 RepID=M1V544_CYAM1|nr:60S acidic ribosomal protein P1 [Cyanidioschyzon merolae strain 10D]BAM80025.1 60S acidic ribosomal protein P1 [Cyanidioschyzon merolae strain 10D]|eukprot:XP_005536311.1 60S acidic ribosomal protein P1 [Cyanidioschyzon merolae strain 10D]